MGGYTVVVSNAFGTATSPEARLTVFGGEPVVVPNSAAGSAVPFGGNTLTAAGLRSQQVYAASHFPGDRILVMTALRFRPDHQYGHSFATTLADFQVNLSTTPDALPLSRQ